MIIKKVYSIDLNTTLIINSTKMLLDTTENAKITPMMQQYLNIKASYEGYMLFYRMGDFYELFFDDAIQAAKTLDIVLTRRGKHLEHDIPMCGVPAHSHEFYLQKLIREGFKVAICEQTESPEDAKKRGGYKAVVERKVVRIITAGTITEDKLLAANQANYLLSIADNKNHIALAWADISTGEFFTTIIEKNNLITEIERIKPNEILVSQKLLEQDYFKPVQQNFGRQISPQAKTYFEPEKGERKLKEFFKLHSIGAFGKLEAAEVAAAGAVLEYILVTQISTMPHLAFPKKIALNEFMQIDYSSMNNLEIFSTNRSENKNSLFSLINKTRTASGSRLFAKNLSHPLLDFAKINARLDVVEFFTKNISTLKALQTELSEMPDIERIISRIHLNRANPRDVAALRNALKQVIIIQQIFEFKDKVKAPSEIELAIKNLGDHTQLYSLLESAIEDFPPVNANEGNFIKTGFNAKLDDYRKNLNSSGEVLAALQNTLREQTGITSLKIKDNNVIGMFIEVTPSHANKAPAEFIHRQTLANAVRYSTPELKEVENKIVNARSYSLALEAEIFEELRQQILMQTPELMQAAHAIATLDFYAALAELALQNNYTRPVLDNSNDFIIEAGRHPVVEITRKNNLGASGVNSISEFVANNSNLDAKNKIMLVTGPNMSGKSTYLRQNALLAIMAQIGSFIPASSAKIGLVDKVFCRVGASDNLARGESTFMVEMVETANILNNATKNSLIILDEIGRGTATFDGLSIAWAILEHLHDNIKARTLFATHYHELTSLKNTLENLGLLTIEVKEWNGNIIYMHKVIEGVASSSYGIHVGQLAGLPKNVTTRANEILELLTSKNASISSDIISADLPLFEKQTHNNSQQKSEFENFIEKTLSEVDIDNITPKQALEILYNIKSRH
jgi:DNA mismatch repair protein MutS